VILCSSSHHPHPAILQHKITQKSCWGLHTLLSCMMPLAGRQLLGLHRLLRVVPFPDGRQSSIASTIVAHFLLHSQQETSPGSVIPCPYAFPSSLLFSSEYSQNPTHVSHLSLSTPAVRFTIIFPGNLSLDALITFLVGLPPFPVALFYLPVSLTGSKSDLGVPQWSPTRSHCLLWPTCTPDTTAPRACLNIRHPWRHRSRWVAVLWWQGPRGGECEGQIVVIPRI
jgi:hypothetical protein